MEKMAHLDKWVRFHGKKGAGIMRALTCFDTPDSFSKELDFTTIGKHFGGKINFDTGTVNSCEHKPFYSKSFSYSEFSELRSTKVNQIIIN